MADKFTVARGVCGAYPLVAFSDGKYEKSEEVSLLLGVIESEMSAASSRGQVEEIAAELKAAFEADYDRTADRVLSELSNLSSNGVARRAVSKAARKALIADKVVKPQEELALERIGRALGLKQGEA